MLSIWTKPLLGRHLKVAGLILFLGSSAAAVFHLASRAKTDSIHRAATPVEYIQNTLDIQRITIRPTGFEPAEITRPAGQFLLAVNDRSGQTDTSITLVRETGERLHTVNMSNTPRKHEWRQVVRLPPGRYLMSEANHPEWICRILLTPN